ncbi:hypothetical protein DOTSEDRAFT_24850 [Dothistroma septosporum NZE10]|uniref:Uncharacterized protein n=1 Tax=Dothistroma septosporum (strain NZE10 / CBS 128990) TaxID=675120 RepID=M2YLP9_DOTSN|nr:hypothetical protein DOTSEDRAFT_24850 [Dothistroma septosporum NZE10]
MSLDSAMSKLAISYSPKKDKSKRRTCPSLPNEIWSGIGKLVVDNDSDFTSKDLRKLDWKLDTQVYEPPITKVCRYLRKELLIYYYQTRVNVSMGVYDRNSGHRSLDQVRLVGRDLRIVGPENRKHIGHVTLCWTVDRIRRRKEQALLRFGKRALGFVEDAWDLKVKLELVRVENGGQRDRRTYFYFKVVLLN